MNASGLSTIYAMSDPFTPTEIKYIGVTKIPLDDRLKNHLRCNGGEKRSMWTSQLLSQGRSPLIWPLEYVDDKIRVPREDYWIRFFYPLGHLLNRPPITAYKKAKLCKSTHNNKLTPQIVSKMREDFNGGKSIRQIASENCVSITCANMAVKRITWRHVV